MLKNPDGSTPEKKGINPLVVIATLFFVFGFVTWLNGTLIPFLKIACGLKLYVQAFMVTFAFYMSYVVMAAPSSWVLHISGFHPCCINTLLCHFSGGFIYTGGRIDVAANSSEPLRNLVRLA